ncbi:MAG: leucine--tRNA ligase [Candidatus Micrarchaeota archaeon]|nr:leucine--tRNA ligase [Candidatus Micrarchaeota archaeon]
MDYRAIEAKWQKAWDEARVYEVEPNEKKGMLVTAAFPYVNAPQHMGHLRTYGTADAYARYKRMRGMNVLYPMGFHATGTPIIAFSKRISANDQELIDELKTFYHVSDENISKMKDPVFIANYFSNEVEAGMKLAGYGIDWRRKLISIEPIFSKLIEWQFSKLKERGYIVQGSHPVGWCPNENNAVGQHDTKHDLQPEIDTVTAVKFREKGAGTVFACATYRPETIYGVTNIFVNDKISYVLAKMGGESYYLSKDAASSLGYQFQISIEKEISGAELLGKSVVNPANGEEIPVFPGYFVDGTIGTGVVMSVPSHAPFDYVALERLRPAGYDITTDRYKKLIQIDNPSDPDAATAKIPALFYLQKINADASSPDDKIDEATKLVYKEEAHFGKMLVGKYSGMPEVTARDRIRDDLIASRDAFNVYTISNDEPVFCRCGYRIVVKIVDNQWFINYGDPAWKDAARQGLSSLEVFPAKYKSTFEKVIEWINLRAAEREQGLGTRFPLNPGHIIESLSDSTIYMSYYTFIHIIRGNGVAAEQLKPELFDYVLNGNGSIKTASKATGIDTLVIQKCRDSFEYWYGFSSRHSGPDLLWNHLTMYLFNHVTIFDRKFWPSQVIMNGSVNYEGQKMSKSIGNVIPLVDALARYGADPIRFVSVAGAELDTDTDFSADSCGGVTTRVDMLHKYIIGLADMKSKELGHLDYWLYSKLHSKIAAATQSMDRLEIKAAYTEIFYSSINELKWYMDRGGNNEIVVREFIEAVTLMLSPVMPHVAEEFWQMLGKSGLVVKEEWPASNEQMINRQEDTIESVIMDTIADVNNTMALTSKIDVNKNKKVSEVKIIIADDWKLKAYNALAKSRSIGSAMSNDFGAGKAVVSLYLKQFAKNLNGMQELPNIGSETLQKAFVEASDYLSTRFGCKVVVESEKTTKSQRASRALPDKPAIDLEWK